MKAHRAPVRVWLLAALVIAVVTACGNGNDTVSTPTPRPPATNTPPPTVTPTATPVTGTGGVNGLLVVHRAVTAGATDALGVPPEPWKSSADSASFDRSLAAANWSIDGGARGVTGPDGRFTTSALSAGPHTLGVTKTLDGDLASLSVPFTVGNDGGADLVIEVAWGQVKSSVTYTHDGAQVREVRAPNGNWLTERDGHIAAFGDSVRRFADPTGSGTFVVTPCVYNTGQPPPDAYDCNADGTCAQPGDRCLCIPSCPACDDCPKMACGPGCPPVEITDISASGPSQLILGQQGSMSATAQLSDGTSFDVTYLVDWQPSDATIASIDSWGTVTALQIGSTSITATLGTLTSTPWPLAVTARPALQKIDVQNVSCFFPLGVPKTGALPPTAMPGVRTDLLPVPNCTQVVQIGGTIQFRAIGEFADGYVQDITDEVQWQVTPPEVGSVAGGVFTAQQAGTASLTAALDTVVSDPTQIRVVTQPTVVALSIYADNGGSSVIMDGGTSPAPVASGMPCFMDGPGNGAPCCCPGPMLGNAGAPCRCNYALTVLRGDQLHFHATAQYDTGAWQDVTAQVTWQSSDTAVASIDTGGVMTALQAGDTSITAALQDVTSDPASVHVVDQATLQSLSIYAEPGQDTVVAKGDQRFFHASGYYDVGITRDVTTEATWHSSDDSVGGFDSPGVFTGHSAGTVQVWADLDGQQSNQLSLEVFETSELTYCDSNHVNRAVWSDDFNRVILESDCASYSQPGVATLRYTVTEIQPHGGIFNPCLDLYVFAGKTPVRTIREEGCGQPFLAANAPGVDQEKLKYQLLAFWDLKDDGGNPVPLGDYTIYGRFYLYYDPVVSLDVTVLAPGQATPTPGPITPPPTASVTPAAMCTPPACPAGTALVCAKGGGASGNVGGGLGCCPSGWDLHPCTSADGQMGLACHNPALACASSGVCGEGCDPVVTGTCDGCSDGCGYICVSGTPPPTATPDGRCFEGAPNCTGSALALSQQGCCGISRSGAFPDGVSWCRYADGCTACSDPCTGLPTPTPVPTIPFCCVPGVGVPCLAGVICPTATPGGCDLACDARPCLGTCPDGQIAKGTCSALTVDRGCECAPDCGLAGTPTPTPVLPPPPIEGACFKGSSQCASVSSLTSQRECCVLAQGLGPEAISWCPIGQLDPSTGACGACGDPCEGLPTPTTTPVP